MAAPNRIDVHQHLLPPVYVDWLRKHGIDDAGGRALPDWSPEAALALMDQIGTVDRDPVGVHSRDRTRRRRAEAVRVARAGQ